MVEDDARDALVELRQHPKVLKHGKPDAKMEAETVLLRIGYRPVDARHVPHPEIGMRSKKSFMRHVCCRESAPPTPTPRCHRPDTNRRPARSKSRNRGTRRVDSAGAATSWSCS